MPLHDVVAIKAGQMCGDLCGAGTTYYFEYDGSSWEPVTADDLGFETEYWMSLPPDPHINVSTQGTTRRRS